MPRPFFSAKNVARRVLLLAAGALICLYALTVLFYAHSVPEVGFRTAFNPDVRGFDGQFDPPEWTPRAGDRLVKLGSERIATWTQFLQLVRSLPSSAVRVQSLD